MILTVDRNKEFISEIIGT